jgi:catechol 2,3-dioxygenase-like lactoylglutathione lyase family enzyme
LLALRFRRTRGRLPRVHHHVAIAVADRAAAEAFYDTVLATLGVGRTATAHDHTEWDGWRIVPAGPDRPPTQDLHVGFVARSREDVDAFWRAGVDAGYESDGEPGPRPQYTPDYYGAFLRDPDGNSAEAVHHAGAGPPGAVDHLWIRVADVRAARDFYASIADRTGFALRRELPDRALFRGPASSFSVVAGPPRTRHVHLAFALAGAETLTDPDGHTISLDEGLSSGRAEG